MSGAKKVLDIGTFTGMSALAMAEGIPNDGQVVTLENSKECAEVAEKCFRKATHGHKIRLLRGDAIQFMKKMLIGERSLEPWTIVLFWITNYIEFG